MTDFENQRENNLIIGAKGGAIAFSLKISHTFLAFLNQVILARILGAGGIGEVILAITVVRISAQIAKFGMEETMMKFIHFIGFIAIVATIYLLLNYHALYLGQHLLLVVALAIYLWKPIKNDDIPWRLLIAKY